MSNVEALPPLRCARHEGQLLQGAPASAPGTGRWEGPRIRRQSGQLQEEDAQGRRLPVRALRDLREAGGPPHHAREHGPRPARGRNALRAMPSGGRAQAAPGEGRLGGTAASRIRRRAVFALGRDRLGSQTQAPLQAMGLRMRLRVAGLGHDRQPARRQGAELRVPSCRGREGGRSSFGCGCAPVCLRGSGHFTVAGPDRQVALGRAAIETRRAGASESRQSSPGHGGRPCARSTPKWESTCRTGTGSSSPGQAARPRKSAHRRSLDRARAQTLRAAPVTSATPFGWPAWRSRARSAVTVDERAHLPGPPRWPGPRRLSSLRARGARGPPR